MFLDTIVFNPEPRFLRLFRLRRSTIFLRVATAGMVEIDLNTIPFKPLLGELANHNILWSDAHFVIWPVDPSTKMCENSLVLRGTNDYLWIIALASVF